MVNTGSNLSDIFPLLRPGQKLFITDGKSSIDLLNFLRTRRTREFERGLIGRKGVEVSKIGLDLAPVIGDCAYHFLPKPIDQLRKEAPKKNMMLGTCQHEGLLFGKVLD